MSRANIIDDTDLSTEEMSFQEDNTDTNDKHLGSKDNAITRKRIDELLEKKRLKELLDEDEWDL